MFLIKSAVFFIGSTVGYRIFRGKLFSQILSLLVWLVISIFVKNLAIPLLFLMILVLIWIIHSILVSKFWRKLQRKHLISYLDAVIFSVQVGKSLKQSIESAARTFNGPEKSYFIQISDAIHRPEFGLEHIGDAKSVWLYGELKKIDLKGHKQIEQLRALRSSLKVMQDFSRKSGQALMQARIQAVVSVLMYVCMGIFSAIQFGFRERLSDYFISGAGLSLGLIWILMMGRNIKWKT